MFTHIIYYRSRLSSMCCSLLAELQAVLESLLAFDMTAWYHGYGNQVFIAVSLKTKQYVFVSILTKHNRKWPVFLLSEFIRLYLGFLLSMMSLRICSFFSKGTISVCSLGHIM